MLLTSYAKADSSRSHLTSDRSPDRLDRARRIDLVPNQTKVLIELLQKCDKAVNACDFHVEQQDVLIVNLEAQNELLGVRIIELEDERPNTLMWFVIGLAAGALTVSIVK